MQPTTPAQAVEQVLEILRKLLELAYEVEADMGDMPGADEALADAILQTEELLTRLRED